MENPPMNAVIVIEDTSELQRAANEWQACRHIAMDTESNSFHAYFERVCLIQVSTSSQDYILDPLSIEDMGPLKAVLEDPRVEKIFHAASNDVIGLKRDYNFKVNNLFDTGIACKLLASNHLGLADILKERFDVTLNKKWQRHDWSKRPLSEEQLNYARQDTRYLIPLRNLLSALLSEKEGLWDAAREAFQKVCGQELQDRPFRPEGFIQIRGARTLDSSGKRILKALYLYREHEARRRDRAPFRIMTNETLIMLASHRPQNVHEFAKIKGMPRTYLKSYQVQNLLNLIRKTGSFRDEAGAK
jgi:ribonuclease D